MRFLVFDIKPYGQPSQINIYSDLKQTNKQQPEL
jgi:hypothetical protein